MPPHVANRHTTPFPFSRPVSLSPYAVRPRLAAPAPFHSLRIAPDKTLERRGDVEPIDIPPLVNPFDFLIEDDAVKWTLAHPDALKEEYAPYLEAAKASLPPEQPTGEYPYTLSMRRPA